MEWKRSAIPPPPSRPMASLSLCSPSSRAFLRVTYEGQGWKLRRTLLHGLNSTYTEDTIYNIYAGKLGIIQGSLSPCSVVRVKVWGMWNGLSREKNAQYWWQPLLTKIDQPLRQVAVCTAYFSNLLQIHLLLVIISFGNSLLFSVLPFCYLSILKIEEWECVFTYQLICRELQYPH